MSPTKACLLRRDGMEPGFRSEPGSSFRTGAVVWRRARRLALAAALLLSAAQGARAESAGDEHYLAVERGERVLDAIHSWALMRWPILEVKDSAETEALARRGHALAQTIFDRDEAMRAMREALAATPGTIPPEFGAIASRIEAAQATMSPGSAGSEGVAGGDRAAIREVSEAMAAPELAGDIALTAQRIKRLYEALLAGRDEELRAMSSEALEASVQDLLEQTRREKDEIAIPPLQPAFVRDEARLALQTVLARLPEDDLALLAAFYASETGRAKRDALIEAFRERNEADVRRFVRQLLDDRRAGRF